MATKDLRKVKPDSKGRILLGIKLTHGVSSYNVVEDRVHGRIILEPNVEIPAKEQWLWKNKTVLKQVKNGLQDSASGKVKSRGSFAKYAVDEK